MFYYSNNPGLSNNAKNFIFFSSLLMMFVAFVFLIRDEAKIPQREIVTKIDISNKVNICQAEEEFHEKSLSDF